MRKWFILFSGGLILLGTSTQALAEPIDFVGTISVGISTLDPVVLGGEGTVEISGENLTSLAFPASIFQVSDEIIEVTDPTANPIVGLVVTGTNLAGTWTDSGGSPGGEFGGVMGIQGLVTVCLFLFDPVDGCPGASLPISLTNNGTNGVGIGGDPVTGTALQGAIAVTGLGAPWTIGAITLPTGMNPGNDPLNQTKRTGFAHGPASNGLSTVGQENGVLSLVTPIRINTNIGPSSFLPAFVILDLTFAPEPGSAALIATAIATVAIVGRRRMRKRR